MIWTRLGARFAVVGEKADREGVRGPNRDRIINRDRIHCMQMARFRLIDRRGITLKTRRQPREPTEMDRKSHVLSYINNNNNDNNDYIK